jgi:hypothetical protein
MALILDFNKKNTAGPLSDRCAAPESGWHIELLVLSARHVTSDFWLIVEGTQTNFSSLFFTPRAYFQQSDYPISLERNFVLF